MTFNEHLAARVRRILAKQDLPVDEKKMMGGITFMVNEKMCVGILKDELMARIAPEEYTGALSKDGCRPMDFTGKPMRGFIFVNSSQTNSDNDLEYWVQLALAFNSRAKASRKVKRKRT